MNREILLAAPWPPAPSEIANNVAKSLVPALHARARLQLIGVPSADGQSIPDVLCQGAGGPVCLPVADVGAVLGSHPNATLLAHLGNEYTQNRAALQALARRPGYVVLHDLTMHHAWFEQCLHTDRVVDYVSSLGEFYGARFQQRAQHAQHNLQIVHDLAKRAPLFEPFLRNALGVVVHSRMAFEAVSQSGRWPVCHLGLPYPAPSAAETDALLAHRSTQAQQLAQGETLRLVVFGHLSTNRCLPLILDAVQMLQSICPQPVRLDIYGRAAEAEKLQAFIDEHALNRCVQLHGFVPEQTLADALHQAHVAFNLRSPTMGEASASQLRLYAAGLPSIIMKEGWYGEQPVDAAFHLEKKPTAIDLVRQTLQILQHPQRLANKAQVGLNYLRQQHDPGRYAQELLAFMQCSHAEGERLLLARYYTTAMGQAVLDMGTGLAEQMSLAVQSLLGVAPKPAAERQASAETDIAHESVQSAAPAAPAVIEMASLAAGLPEHCLLARADLTNVATFMQQHIDLQTGRPPLEDDFVLRADAEVPVSFIPPAASDCAKHGSPSAQAALRADSASQQVPSSKPPTLQSDPNLAELQRRAQPRLELHGKPRRGPLKLLSAASRALLGIWNRISRQWREPFELIHRIEERYAEVLDHHVQRIEQLQGQINYLILHLSDISSQCAEHSSHAATVDSQLLQQDSQLIQIEGAQAALTHTAQELATQSRQIDRYCGELTAQSAWHGDQIHQLNQHVTLINAQAEQTSTHLSSLAQDLEQLGAQGRQLSTHVGTLTHDVEQLGAQGQQLSTHVGTLTHDVEQLGAQGQQLSAHLNSLTHDVEQLGTQGQQVTAQLSQVHTHLDEINAHLDQVGANVNQHGSFVTELSKHVAALGEQNIQVGHSLEKFSSQTDHIKAQSLEHLQDMRQLAMQLQQENNQLRERISSGLQVLDSRIQNLTSLAPAMPVSDGPPANGLVLLNAGLPTATPPVAGLHDDTEFGNPQVNAFMQHVADFFRGNSDELRGSLALNLDAVAQAMSQVTAQAQITSSQGSSQVAADAAYPVLDVGCGRGEWLSLLKERGYAAHGVDMSAQCVSACLAQGLDVRQADGLRMLRYTPPQSLAVVTAFHLVEHLSLEGQIQLFSYAYTALAPGGLLLVETPNPENLAVISRNFWYDPTHQRPLPSLMLRLLALHAGFASDHIQTEPIHPGPIPALEIEHYPPRTRHMLFCGEDTILRAWKR
ncbi:MAG: methyltransferase domain-containing protein [Burkholderiaceae bacterium]